MNLYTFMGLDDVEEGKEIISRKKSFIKRAIVYIKIRRQASRLMRNSITRDRVGAHERLIAAFFSDNPMYDATRFRKTFRMARPLFNRIVTAVTNYDPFLHNNTDRTEREGISPLIKSNNDINVLYQSPLFNDHKTGRAPEIPFVANDVSYPSGYCLIDEIYPELAPLVKTILEPADDDHKRILYKQKQKSARKDVERAFGVFKKKWVTFTGSMLLNLDQLEKQLDKKEFQETGSIDSFIALMIQFQTFINFRYYFYDFDGTMICKYFQAHTRIKIQQFYDTLIQHMESLRESILERAKHKREKDRRVNDRMMQSKERKDNSSNALDADLVITKSNETESERHVLSSKSRNDTYTDDTDINSVNDKQPMAKVQLSAEHNILANEQQHSEQSESVYDTYLLEKINRNTTPESTDMSHREERLTRMLMLKNIQEKVFANAALKNELRKSKGNNVDTKFAKPSILGKPVLQPPRNQFVVRQPNTFKSERPNFSKPRFASQVDVNSVLSKPVTPHYLPKVRESASEKPHHVNAPSSSKNSKKESYDSNDMAHNYYLEEAKKRHKTKIGILNLGKCLLKCVFNANHDACITKFLKEVNSRAKIQPNKTRNSNKPVDPTSHTQKLGRKIVTGHSFPPHKLSAVLEKTNTPRSCLWWILTGRIFNTGGLKWVPTGKTFTTKTSLHAPFLKEKKGVRFSALYLQKKINLLVSYVNV
nr:actin-binding, cofilin/tropomyosin type [Tanacetum cinerariifolium]